MKFFLPLLLACTVLLCACSAPAPAALPTAAPTAQYTAPAAVSATAPAAAPTVPPSTACITLLGPNDRQTELTGAAAVRLAALLAQTQYAPGTCRCRPEYTVRCENTREYGLNLTHGYARLGSTQASLSTEQLQEIRNIIAGIQ